MPPAAPFALELEIFAELRARTEALAEPVRRAAEALARLDVWAAAAAWAVETNAVRPEISTGSELVIEGGRHPVVEAALARSGEGRFTPNDCSLDGEGKTASRLLLVTGPPTWPVNRPICASAPSSPFWRRPDSLCQRNAP